MEEDPTMNKSNEAQIMELEKEYWQALKDKDVDTCERLTDFPCLLAGPHGVHRIPKEKFRGIMESGIYTLDEFKLKDSEVRMLTDDVAIHAYTVHEELTVDGEPVSMDAAQSSTWIRRPSANGEWVCALHTESIFGDSFGRDKKKAA
jgi:ketosteroid isomerase-like protein